MCPANVIITFLLVLMGKSRHKILWVYVTRTLEPLHSIPGPGVSARPRHAIHVASPLLRPKIVTGGLLPLTKIMHSNLFLDRRTSWLLRSDLVPEDRGDPERHSPRPILDRKPIYSASSVTFRVHIQSCFYTHKEHKKDLQPISTNNYLTKLTEPLCPQIRKSTSGIPPYPT
jgi:hypothetical protein